MPNQFLKNIAKTLHEDEVANVFPHWQLYWYRKYLYNVKSEENLELDIAK